MANSTQWKLPDDPLKKGLQHPNYNIYHSPSGHMIVIDDSKDNESVTIKHRSGATFQLHPDGSMVFIAKAGKYEVTFGDSNMMITGAQNVTVNGGATLKVEGDYDLTVNGNMKSTVKGNLEQIVAGNMSTAVQGDSETVVGGNQSTKVAENSEYHGENVYVGGEGKVGVKAASGNLELDSGGKTLVGADGNIELLAGSEINLDQG